MNESHGVRRLLGGLALAAALGLLLRGQAGQADDKAKLPPAKEIMAKSLEAMGGKEALLKHSSSHHKGKFEMPAQGITGELEIFAAKPAKFMLKVNIPNFGEFLQGYDGKVGWSMNPIMGPKILEGKQLEEAAERAQFHGEVTEADRVKSMETLEETKFDNKDCYKVKIVRKSGSDIIRFYDKKTFLIVGEKRKQETDMGTVDATVTVSDYKKFDGVLMATKTKVEAGPIVQELTVTSVEYDKVDDKTFALPEMIKALVK